MINNTKTNESFEEFLKERHAKHYIGTNDDMHDGFENWIADFDTEDWLMYGQIFGSVRYTNGFSDASDNAIKIINNNND